MSTVTAKSGTPKDTKYRNKLIGYAIALVFMFIMPSIIPTWATVNEMGVKMLCTFVGIMAIFMTSGDLICGSIVGLIACLVHGYINVAGVWSGVFGNSTSGQIIAMLAFSVAVRDTGALDVLGRWLIRKCRFLQKVPMLFSIVFMLAMMVCLWFVGGTTATFTLIPMFEGIAKSVGYKVDEKWHKVMITGLFMLAGGGGQTRGTGGMALGFVNTFAKSVNFEYTYQPVQFMISTRVGLALFVILFVLLAKFIFRCDMNKLARVNMDEVEELKAENVKFSKAQKIMLVLFLLVLFRAFVANPFPKTSSVYNLYETFSMPIMAFAALVVSSMIKIEGKPIVSVERCFSKMMWGVIFSLGTMSIVAGAVASDATGIRPWLVKILTPIYGGHPYILFVFLILLTTCIITNLMSNQATIIIMLSVTATFIETYVAQGINPTPFIGSIVCVGMIPLLTYSAGPISPIYLNRPEMNSGFVYTTGAAMMLLSVCCFTFSAVLFGQIF